RQEISTGASSSRKCCRTHSRCWRAGHFSTTLIRPSFYAWASNAVHAKPAGALPRSLQPRRSRRRRPPADYAAFSEIFPNGLDRLIALGRERRCAMTCSEAVWWRCHRRLVADHLMARGETVFRLMGNDRIEPARLTKG